MNAVAACILGCEGTALRAAERSFFAETSPWGFILFARNVDSPDQLRRLTGDLRDVVARDAPVFVDQEGGRVQRLRAPHWREWPPALDMVDAAGPHAPRAMYLRARLIAAELRAVGIDGNCAPVVDIAGPLTHPFLRNRCYGRDLATVIAVARAVAGGLRDGGVLPVMKHMPGHGRATMDTHTDLPRVAEAAQALRNSDFAAFRALSDLPLGMTAHIVFSAFDDQPATCSAPMIRLIREEIGFGGLLMTDDLSMQALSGTLAERAAAARRAGCDVMLHCNGKRDEMQAVAAASGVLAGAALARAGAALAARRAPDGADPAALDAELRQLVQGRADA
ncbi:MAG: beta-N-acetylhexosaminidase [Rhodobacter sp.]|nr:beta-N-acetylhexosaminidase [Rhodobacter sp.]MCA3494323.1 beta-N-acetylhexosaminidase [Rhodobacter sp.]MCA3501339.1 beta-N-acetylhexosaminidase [Rhodobacter sp.]MCA3503584.1 beta-N-acetylhexosaminidase [Rhodobacter sp.]MCA3516933.1 beta-N-acetylhexosaminidase [Rhodobacter sp.]